MADSIPCCTKIQRSNAVASGMLDKFCPRDFSSSQAHTIGCLIYPNTFGKSDKFCSIMKYLGVRKASFCALFKDPLQSRNSSGDEGSAGIEKLFLGGVFSTSSAIAGKSTKEAPFFQSALSSPKELQPDVDENF